MRASILLAGLLACFICVWSAQRFSASGLVLRVDPNQRTILLSCDDIAGYMRAMTMSFAVRDSKILAGLAPGLRVEFTLVVGGQSSYAEDIHARNPEDMEQQALTVRRLKMIENLDAGRPLAPGMLKVGEPVPGVVLMDQNRNKVDLSGFAGKVVLMNFIYTHCPLPDYCFRLSNNLGNVQRRFRAKMGRDLILLSVTFDPVHDQPEVLRDYARTWKADGNWHFLTGELSEVRRVCKMFDVDFWPDEAELMHSLHTVIINRQGRLAANLEGNQFTARQLGDLVQTVLDEAR